MMQFSIGVSALQASQKALEITGNNITNANTPGYHRQVVQLSSVQPVRVDGLSLGRGVEISGVQRTINENIEAALLQQASQTGSTETQLSALTRIESRLADAEASPGGRLETLFNQLEQLSARLNDSATRRVVIGSADRTAKEFNSLATDMYRQREGLDQSIVEVVREVSPLTKQIAQLNQQIAELTAQGIEPNDLLDQRSQAVQELGQRLEIKTQPGNQGQITVMASGVPLVISKQYQELIVQNDGNDLVSVRLVGSDEPLEITGGQLGGLLIARNKTLPGYHDRLDTLAREVISAFNAVQSTGVGVAGAFTTLSSQQPVNLSIAKLNSAGLPFPPKSGSLYVGMTNTATGQRELTEIVIDPTMQSLVDVAGSIAAIPNLQAFVNSQSGTMSLFSSPGFTFDFRGGIDEIPTPSFTAGTTTAPKMGGVFTGTTNDRYSFTFMGSGTIGVTSGLQMRVTDQQGSTVATIDIGQGYETGKPLAVADGLTVTLSAGTVVSGESFASRVIGAPDTAGVLNALGLNSFFIGQDAATLQVSKDLLANSDRLATSHSGQPGDSVNLQRLVALRDAPSMLNGSTSMSDYFTLTVSDIGSDVLNLTDLHDTNQLLTDRLDAERQSVSGVDANEEMVNLLKYQRMFQIAAKYINTVNQAFDELLSIQ